MTSSNDDTAVIEIVPAGPRDDDLAAELARAAPRRWWNRGTVVLGAIVLVVGGFAGGLQAQKQWGTAATPAAGRAFGGQNPGGSAAAGGMPDFGGGQARGGQAQGGQAQGGTAQGGTAPGGTAAAAATGKVKLVNGTTIYVETADGQVVTVKTDSRTSVSTATKGKVSDVKAGQSVTIQGSAGSDGTVTATSVTAAG
ncbi:hypothetical protein [Paractinoplanes brasiliensis]|uniref:DUF5666 domain-containing protein n=1 Tax=Paractinoplanes brasiliensis TaxID=52695 RepID=A0A4R6K0H1_9ACTN|nr:hypothetical protein [Actinoplanes brasiliensis]TDO42559.1 hypothetical protein C8E87_6332 [Actinoplanes brasiliensis]GID31336.1 hypothetical protein Abr02nite_63190 [Actinoplanes brasiliensis]